MAKYILNKNLNIKKSKFIIKVKIMNQEKILAVLSIAKRKLSLYGRLLNNGARDFLICKLDPGRARPL